MPNLTSILPLLFDGLPAELLSDPDKRQLEKMAQNLPLASGGILEVPLSENTGPVGLGMRLVHKEGGFALLENPEVSFKVGTGAHKAWQMLQQFAQARKDATQPLRRAVNEGWLEFDITPKTKALPAPGFFFKLEEPFSHPATAGVLKEAAHHSSVALIQKGVEILGAAASAESVATLTRCIHARNASTSIAYIGVMMGRKTPGFRLVLAGMPFYSVMAYLKKIEYPQRKGMLPLVDFLSQRIGLERLSLQLDIHGDIQPRLGLEITMDPQLNLPAAWQNFLGQLIHTGACTPARAGALPAWIRQFQRAQMLETWPEALGRKYGSLHRSINHVKFSYQPGYFSQEIPPGDFGGPLANQARAGEISAKAYLAYQYAAGLPPAPLWATDAH